MPHTKAAFDQLDNLTPTFRENAKPKSLLYIGWRHDCKRWWYDTFAKQLGITDVGVLEIFEKNFGDLDHRVWCGEYDLKLYLGDATKIDQTKIHPGQYDIIFWDHGPEHVSKEAFQAVTPLLTQYAGKMLLYCCPWGDWPQGEEDGNKFEVHQWSPTVQDFLDVGLTVVSTGESGQAGEGELIGFSFKP